ncbi:MAG: type 1 glutamine amidotransferase [Dehalococcoidia bacterium]|nr:type 1 glutamine amidotransferase [Dehalococcoidia bacterium]
MAVLVLQNIACEGPGLLATALEARGVSTHIVRMGQDGSLPSIASYQGLVTLGGPMNVDEGERHPFLRDEVKVLQQALRAGVPVLGICLGAQLLAKALGARVFPARAREIGFSRVQLTEEGGRDPLFRTQGRFMTVFQWHGDTFDLPRDAVSLASSAVCPQQAFRYGRAAYGLQFHLEVTPGMVASWVREYPHDLAMAGLEDRGQSLVAEARTRAQDLAQQAGEVFGAFATLVEGRRSERVRNMDVTRL